MNVSCDLFLSCHNGRHFTWAFFVRSLSMSAAAAMAEQHAGKQLPNAKLEELDLQLIGSDALGDSAEPGVYSDFGPRQVVQHEPLLARLWANCRA